MNKDKATWNKKPVLNARSLQRIRQNQIITSSKDRKYDNFLKT